MAPEVLTGRGEGGLQGYTSACDMWSLGVVGYMLLSGRRPFHHSDREEKRRLVKEGKASFEHEAWDNVSAAAQDFVRSLLQRDPKARFTAKQALEDPWIKQMCASQRGAATTPAEEMQRNSLVLHSLQDFMHAEAMHKVALEVVAFTAPPASFDELRKLFKAIDTDNSGTISYEELKKAMENYPEIPEVQVRRLFEAVDMNHKGEVEYNSFLAATCSAQQVIGEPTLRTAFSVLDRDSDGVITKEDLMETVGQACSEEEIDQVSHAGGSRLCTPPLHTSSAHTSSAHLPCTPPLHTPLHTALHPPASSAPPTCLRATSAPARRLRARCSPNSTSTRRASSTPTSST